MEGSKVGEPPSRFRLVICDFSYEVDSSYNA
jgi:hypothetical protein